jgi:hypothetical protein
MSYPNRNRRAAGAASFLAVLAVGPGRAFNSSSGWRAAASEWDLAVGVASMSLGGPAKTPRRVRVVSSAAAQTRWAKPNQLDWFRHETSIADRGRAGVADGETGHLTDKAKNASFRQKRLADFISTRTRAGAPMAGFSPKSRVSRMEGTPRPASARSDVFDPRRSSPRFR